MKSASRHAETLIDELTLVYNKTARQDYEEISEMLSASGGG